MKRGDIYRASLDPVIGSEQGGVRPVLIVQNDMGNLHSPTVAAERPKKNTTNPGASSSISIRNAPRYSQSHAQLVMAVL